jgi:hypothetical protein
LPGTLLVLFSAPYWATRSLYDDELYSLGLARLPSLARVWQAAVTNDVHPPLHYVYAWLWLRAPLPVEWAAKASGLFACLVALALVERTLRSIGWSVRRSLLASSIAAVHPNLMLWGSAFRWYPLWSCLNVALCAAALAWWRKPNLRSSSLLVLCAALASLTNYASLITGFALLLVGGFWLPRCSADERLWRLRSLALVSVALLALLALYWPCLHVHLQNIGTQVEHTSRTKALAYALFAILLGQSVWPWQWAWTGVGALGLCLALLRVQRTWRSERALFSVAGAALCAVSLFAFALATTKARNLLGYSMCAGVVCGALLERPRDWLWLAPLLGFWLYADVNVLRRQSLHKAGLQDPIALVSEEVVRTAQAPDTLIALTNNVIGYYVSQRLGSTRMCTVYDLAAQGGPASGCPKDLGHFSKVLFIDSYLGSLMAKAQEHAELERVLASHAVESELGHYGYDADFEQKNRWFPGAGLRPWRHRLVMFSLPTPMAEQPEVRSALEHFFNEPLWGQ